MTSAELRWFSANLFHLIDTAKRNAFARNHVKERMIPRLKVFIPSCGTDEVIGFCKGGPMDGAIRQISDGLEGVALGVDRHGVGIVGEFVVFQPERRFAVLRLQQSPASILTVTIRRRRT